MKLLLKLLKRHKVVVIFLGISLLVFVLSYLVLPKGEYRDLAYWIKFFIIICGSAIAFIELAEWPKKEAHRKRLMYSLFFVLLLLSIKDTSEETIGTKNAQNKMDSLIIAEKKRADTVISNLRESLDTLKSTRSIVNKLNDTLNVVKDSLTEQVVTLRNVIQQSEDYTILKQKEFNAGRPYLVFYSGATEFIIDSSGIIKTVNIKFGNAGKRRATSLKYKVRWYIFNQGSGKIYGDNREFRKTGMYTMSNLATLKAGDPRILKIPVGIKDSIFLKTDIELLLAFRIYLKDDFGYNTNVKFFMSASEFDGKDFEIGEFNEGKRMEALQRRLKVDNDFKEFFDE
ncbi:MAG: hypothetical protein AAFU57_04970 [Bacteroidota bacterium]